MNLQTKLEAKKILLTVALFFSLLLILAGMQFALTPYAETGLKQAANLVIKEWNNKADGIGEVMAPSGLGWSYKTYSTNGKGKKTDRVFIVRITGNSGPFTGIFYYTPLKGTEFCGLAGVGNQSRESGRFGITGRIISKWTDTFDGLAEKTGAEQ